MTARRGGRIGCRSGQIAVGGGGTGVAAFGPLPAAASLEQEWLEFCGIDWLGDANWLMSTQPADIAFGCYRVARWNWWGRVAMPESLSVV